MSRKNLVIFIIITALIILGVGIFLLFFTAPPIENTNNTAVNKGTYAPFGTSTDQSFPSTQSTSTVDTTGNQDDYKYVNNPASPLIKISTTAIAGAEVFDRKIGKATPISIVRYMERATAHVQDFNPTTFSLSNSSNTTIPTIYQAWLSGSGVLAQSLAKDRETVRTFTSTLSTTASTTSQLIGSYLPDNIYTLSVSPKGNRIFYITKGSTAQGYISNLDGTKKLAILNFPFNEWNTQWPNETTITLTSRASYNSTGFTYLLSATTGSMTKVLGNVLGLNTLTSPSLGYIMYSGSTYGTVASGIYDVKKGAEVTLKNPIKTLAEKCVWSKLVKTTAYCAVPKTLPSGNYPDDWYQGNVQFNDNIYKIDLNKSSAEIIYTLPTDQSIDAINLFLDTKESNLYFTNKNNYYLWGLNLKGI